MQGIGLGRDLKSRHTKHTGGKETNMIVTIEIDTERYDVSVTDKSTGTVWMLESDPEMEGTIITPDTNLDNWIR